MLKAILIPLLILACITGCKRETSVEPFNYERDTPTWLKEKINAYSQNKDYFGTKVFRYEWKSSTVYYFAIPISSCAFCDVYNANGIKIFFSSDQMIQDFLDNRKNEVLVWEWKSD